MRRRSVSEYVVGLGCIGLDWVELVRGNGMGWDGCIYMRWLKKEVGLVFYTFYGYPVHFLSRQQRFRTFL